MKPSDLIATGLNAVQAQAYALLIERGSVSPPQLAESLKLSRSNAYKVLDQLVGLRLAKRKEVKKKYIYFPDNPMALTDLVAEQRNIATVRENAVKGVLKNLLAAYHSHTEQPAVQVVTGRDKVVDAYRQQIMQLEPIYFIRSRADIPIMGFDVMHEVRTMPANHDVRRYGITPSFGSGGAYSEGDKRSNLKRTWVRQQDYDAPVEWSISGSSLLIVLFGDEPHAITITNPLIADAFLQLWRMLDSCLRAMSYYSDLVDQAKNNAS